MFTLFRKFAEWAGFIRAETPSDIGPFSRDLTWRVLWHARDFMVKSGYSISAFAVMDAWETLNEFYETSPSHVIPMTYSAYFWDARSHLRSIVGGIGERDHSLFEHIHGWGCVANGCILDA